MNGQDVCTGLSKLFKVSFRLNDHQVNVKWNCAGSAHCANNSRTKCNWRDKVPIHYINVDPVCSGGDYFLNLVMEVSPISG